MADNRDYKIGNLGNIGKIDKIGNFAYRQFFLLLWLVSSYPEQHTRKE